MKNRLYYLLAVLYVLMFAIILYINGAFSGESISVSNLAINVAFLIVIGILFIISFVSFSRLNRVTDSLVDTAEEMSAKYESVQKSLWDEYRTKKDTFSSPAKEALPHRRRGSSVSQDMLFRAMEKPLLRIIIP